MSLGLPSFSGFADGAVLFHSMKLRSLSSTEDIWSLKLQSFGVSLSMLEARASNGLDSMQHDRGLLGVLLAA